MKIAIIEASHWQVPLCFAGIEKLGLNVVAVSDREDFAGGEVSTRFNCPLYGDYPELLAEVADLDFFVRLWPPCRDGQNWARPDRARHPRRAGETLRACRR